MARWHSKEHYWWPKSGPLALNGVLLVAQKWPAGKQGVKDTRWALGKITRVIYEPRHEKPVFFICENKDADQLRGNRKADQRL